MSRAKKGQEYGRKKGAGGKLNRSKVVSGLDPKHYLTEIAAAVPQNYVKEWAVQERLKRDKKSKN
jgi:hypothetical protein